MGQEVWASKSAPFAKNPTSTSITAASTPVPVPSFSNLGVVQIVCGENATLILTRTGKVYSQKNDGELVSFIFIVERVHKIHILKLVYSYQELLSIHMC